MKRNDRPAKKLKKVSELNYYNTKSMIGTKKSQSSLDKLSTLKIYQILSKKERTLSTLLELNKALEVESNLASLSLNDSGIDGSFLHYLTQTAQANEDISWRMVYSLSNAGIDVNIQNQKGNTALHLAYIRGYLEVGFNFIEALLKVGTMLELKNVNNKTAFDYMEDIEQLSSMFNAHYPGLWTAVEKVNVKNVEKLMNGWVKVNLKSRNKDLIEIASKKAIDKADVILELLNKHKFLNELIHAIYSIDVNRVQSYFEHYKSNFNPNTADLSYCYTWFKPTYRNLPKFILEIAIETASEPIIQILLTNGCNVNFLNSKTGNPLYFSAFVKNNSNFKIALLKGANFNIKNYCGQSILFYLVHLYTLYYDADNFETIKDTQILIEDFRKIITNIPILLTHRDQDNQTLVEMIITLEPKMYKKALVFLKEISDFILRILDEKNLKIIQKMIYLSYGLVLKNSLIFPKKMDALNLSVKECVTLEDYILEKNLAEFIQSSEAFESDFLNKIYEFNSAIKRGDLNSVKKYIESDDDMSLTYSRDYSGRSCLHLAVLYTQPNIVSFLLQNKPQLTTTVDNCGRSALHYAFGLKDNRIIGILLSYNIDQNSRDSKFLLPDEYELEEVVNDEAFRVKNFKQNELNNENASKNFMKCFVYKSVKAAILENQEEQLKKISNDLKPYDLSLKDLPFWHTENLFVHGEHYVPPLEMAMEASSFSAFRYILENTVETKVRLLSAAPAQRSNTALGQSKNSFSFNKSMELSLISLREKAELLEMDEIIDILDNFEEDKEIKALERENSEFNFNYEDDSKKIVKKYTNISFKSLPNSNPNQVYLKGIMKKPSHEANDKSLFKLQALLSTENKKIKSNSIHKIENVESIKYISSDSRESKLCSIV